MSDADFRLNIMHDSRKGSSAASARQVSRQLRCSIVLQFEKSLRHTAPVKIAA
jgi:hypothetical protein